MIEAEACVQPDELIRVIFLRSFVQEEDECRALPVEAIQCFVLP
jgi:hypothetical protein